MHFLIGIGIIIYLSKISEAKSCCWYLQEATAAAIKAELAAAIVGPEDLVIKMQRRGKILDTRHTFSF